MGNLLYYAIVFLVVALVAAALGFGGVAGTAMEGARLLFWVALVLFRGVGGRRLGPTTVKKRRLERHGVQTGSRLNGETS